MRERQTAIVISLTLGILSLLTPLFTQLRLSAEPHHSPESTLLAGRGEESDKCVWLGICD
ncbi:MAG: hypothetical protein R6U67_15080 [Sodalinema sp.]|uniref:hypothetical protein n=1 Tax=Sodalinema sp. TaxID=3080550 RepID=UPI001218DB2F|nr:MAG: hypothetical protein EYR95_12470 [Phormidium sp. SL48-SHIP]